MLNTSLLLPSTPDMPTSCKVVPTAYTSSRGLAQSNSASENQRHAPFHSRRGSMDKAFITMASDARPQYAGSSCDLCDRNEERCSIQQVNTSVTSRQTQPLQSRTWQCKHRRARACRSSSYVDMYNPPPPLRAADYCRRKQEPLSTATAVAIRPCESSSRRCQRLPTATATSSIDFNTCDGRSCRWE